MIRLPACSTVVMLHCLMAMAAIGVEPCATDLSLSDEATDEAMIGTSIAIDGDWAVVGAPLDTGNGWASGVAYVYRWEADAWLLDARLIADDGEIGDMFGVSVDIKGDRIIVGSWFDNDAGSNSGSAYIFDRTEGAGWEQAAKIVMPDAQAEDVFGRTVALGDEFCAVGAPLDDDQGQSSGSVVVFDRDSTGVWSFVAKLAHPGGGGGDQLGLSLTIDGDRILAGAPWSNDGRGEVHLWERFAAWTHVWMMTMETVGSPDDYFGFSVALDGDHMAVGTYRDDSFGLDAGSIWIMSKVFDGWAFEKYPPPNPQSGAMFGVSIDLSGDLLLAGAYYGEVDGLSTGTVDIMSLAGTQWVPAGSLEGNGLVAGAEFGWSVALDGDRALVGAPYQIPVGDLQAWSGLLVNCNCPADVTGDGQVGVDDILAVLEAYGSTCTSCEADLDGDGQVGVDDILLVIAGWASC
ncbi:MAG: FG-GAP repeat protein [Phycisphaerales bacterium]|nr:FG-GAP repeat protein [Phycisphaerales bacterium]